MGGGGHAEKVGDQVTVMPTNYLIFFSRIKSCNYQTRNHSLHVFAIAVEDL